MGARTLVGLKLYRQCADSFVGWFHAVVLSCLCNGSFFVLYLLWIWAPQGIAILVCSSHMDSTKRLTHVIDACAAHTCLNHDVTNAKWQHSQLCRNFRTLVFNNQGRKLTEKLMWVYPVFHFYWHSLRCTFACRLLQKTGHHRHKRRLLT